MVTDESSAAFGERGFVVIPGAVTGECLAKGRRAVAALLEREPPPVGFTGAYYLVARFSLQGHPPLDLYRRIGIGRLAGQLLRPDLAVPDPDLAQVATTVPSWRRRPGGPHVDVNADDKPQRQAFSLLAGVWLTDQTQPDHGNLYVWPGTHLRFGQYLAGHGADAVVRLSDACAVTDCGEPVQATGPADSVLFAHYLLGHNMGGHFFGPAGDPRRQTVYYRLLASGHRGRWRQTLTSPLLEFRQP
jgi:hypothetical protein